jgi:SAM-dependent methyltransferase
VNCAVCKSSRVKALRDYKSPFVDKWYTLYSCEECRSRFFNLDQHPIDPGEIYEQYAEKNADRYTAEFKASFYWKNQVDVITHLCGHPVNSVLDVGCRTGDFLMHWPQEIARVGIEISAHSASIAIKRGLRLTQTPLEKAEFAERFDVVTCYAIVEHLPDPSGFLQNLPRLVNENGIVVIMIPTWQCLKQSIVYALGKQWHMYSPPLHLNFLSRGKLDQMMKEYGFRLIRRTYTSGGLFNPFNKMPLAGRVFAKLMSFLDAYSPLNRLPAFDHLYSYYLRQ